VQSLSGEIYLLTAHEGVSESSLT